ncbi:hypothetical protein ACFV2N_46010 [Streptomyces sp. NPDC059680]|uniref:hypothetical protein n=1 Tax=Streptomyces sp. NPDC059680 TaxID=3346904 RepID=UPI0036B4B252
MTRGSGSRIALARAMQELEMAAGCMPRSVTRPRSRAIRQANELCRSRGLPLLVGTTVSDWIRLGRAAEDFEQLWCLVATLLTWARDSNGAGFPAERSTRRYWKQLWDDARSASTPAGEQGVARLGSPVACFDPVRALEVHPAIETYGSHSESPLPLYIPREHDRRLREETGHALRGSRLVILVADSSTGKTRALWEAIRQLPDGWLVWRPPDRPALLDGLAADRPLRRTVVWLNETQRYLYSPHAPAEGEKIAAALTGLLLDPERGPVLVVGTLWRDGHALLSAPPTSQQALDPHAHARSLLASATVIEVPEQFDTAALADVRRRAVETRGWPKRCATAVSESLSTLPVPGNFSSDTTTPRPRPDPCSTQLPTPGASGTWRPCPARLWSRLRLPTWIPTIGGHSPTSGGRHGLRGLSLTQPSRAAVFPARSRPTCRCLVRPMMRGTPTGWPTISSRTPHGHAASSCLPPASGRRQPSICIARRISPPCQRLPSAASTCTSRTACTGRL